MRDKLNKLIDLKSIITIILSVVFCFLAIRSKVTIEGKDFMQILTAVFVYYFARKENNK